MPDCPNDTRLIRWLAGELAENEQNALADHLQACASCRERHRAIKGTWDLLGEWGVSPPPCNLAASVRQAVQERPSYLRWWRPAGQVAAAVLLAVTIGIVAGVLTPVRSAQSPFSEVSANDVAKAIGIEMLAGSDGLEQLFLESDGGLPELPEAQS